MKLSIILMLLFSSVNAMDGFAGIKLRDKCTSLPKLSSIKYRHYSNAPNKKSNTILRCGGQLIAGYKGGDLYIVCEGNEVVSISYLKDVPKNLTTSDFEEVMFSEYGKPKQIKRRSSYNYYLYSEKGVNNDGINIQFSPGSRYDIHFDVPDRYKASKEKERVKCFQDMSKKSFNFIAK